MVRSETIAWRPLWSGTNPPIKRICSRTAAAAAPSRPEPGTGRIEVHRSNLRLRALASLVTDFQLFSEPSPINEYTSTCPLILTAATALLETGAGSAGGCSAPLSGPTGARDNEIRIRTSLLMQVQNITKYSEKMRDRCPGSTSGLSYPGRTTLG